MEDIVRKLNQDILKKREQKIFEIGMQDLEKQKEMLLDLKILEEKDSKKREELISFREYSWEQKRKWEREKNFEDLMRNKTWDDPFGRK